MAPVTNDEGREFTSPIPSEISSLFNTPKTSFFKRTIKKCNRKLQLKSNLVQNLKKQNKRLKKNNTNLKQIIQELKSKGLADESLCTDLNHEINETNSKIMSVLTAKKKRSFLIIHQFYGNSP